MRSITVVLALVGAAAVALAAQEPKSKPEIRIFTGAQIATGPQRRLFTDSPLFGVQLASEVRPTLHLVGSFGWIPSQVAYSFSNDNVNIFEYTVGLELGLQRSLPANWLLKPFLGAGAGGRTYVYAAPGISDQTCTMGYVAGGTEFQFAKTAFRLEARDNLFCYQSPIAGQASKTRNDVGLSLGVAYHLR